jgi:hypothetical protein
MTPHRSLVVALSLVLLAACGGTGSSGAPGNATLADLVGAAPSIQQVELGIAPMDFAPSTMMPPAPPAPTMADLCNPHLLSRGEEIANRVNRHLYKILVHVEEAIASDAAPSTTGLTATFHKSRHGIDAELNVTRKTATDYGWTLLLKKKIDSTWTQVADGDVDRKDAAGPHQGKGHMNLDLGKVASVTGDEVAGTISADFANFADRRLASVHAAGIVWDTDSRNGFVRAPRSADYVSFRKTGVGGSLKVSEEAPFACPWNPGVTQGHLTLVNRWYLPSGGGLHGRSDAALTGGQLDALKIAVVQALTCHQSAVPTMMPAEGAWLIKAEDAAGKTMWGWERLSGATPCDPLLNPPSGAVPSLTDNKTDFSFAGIGFSDGNPYPFPGM